MTQETNLTSNGVKTIISESRKPIQTVLEQVPAAFIPDGYELETFEHMLPAPLRKKGTLMMTDRDSFIDFVMREGSLASCRIYADVNFAKNKVCLTAVINDNAETAPNWRDYRVIYEPPKSVEWSTWTANDGKAMTQAAFANFLEENVKDIATIPDMPSGTQILAMALDFEAKKEFLFKSAIRQQSGTVSIECVDREDDTTIKKMEFFQRFGIGIGPFFNGQMYQLLARLKYQTGNAKLTFWYELIRPDLILQDATNDLIKAIRDTTGFPVFYGQP